MHSNALHKPLPSYVRPPLRFRERGCAFEGEVDHPSDIVRMFEPVDVLDGATELVDQNGLVITIGTADPTVVKNNEYPKNCQNLFYAIHGQADSERDEGR
jgi:hypothetical protein